MLFLIAAVSSVSPATPQQPCARGRARELWPKLVALHEKSDLEGMDEAHVLSMLYATLGLVTGDAAPFVKRLWTQPFRCRNTAPGDEALALWHVPRRSDTSLRRAVVHVRERRGGLASARVARPVSRSAGEHGGEGRP